MKGITVKEKLLLAHIKQVDLTSRLGMSKQSLSNMLNSESHVSSDFLEKICEALGVNMSFFYPEIGGTVNDFTTNVRKQSAHNLSTGSGNITEQRQEGASEDIIQKLLESNAKKDEQIAQLIDKLTLILTK